MALKWSDGNEKGIKDKVKGFFKTDNKPLKPRLEETRRNLQLYIAKLNNISIKLDEQDRALFKKIINDIQKRNEQHATILSSELTQIRKIKKMVNSAKFMLEQIELRIGTISDVGDVVVSLRPAMSTVNSIRSDLVRLMPEASNEINDVTNMLNEIMINSNIHDAHATELYVSDEAQSILEEASRVVEANVKTKLPDLPSNIRASSNAKKSVKRYPDLPSTKSKKRIETPI